MTTTKYGFEVKTADGWSADAAGHQDASNTFASRGDAEAELPALAQALGVSADDVRVCELQVAVR